jgi:hypothetical protein
VNDLRKRARWLYYLSTILFIVFILLSGGPLQRLFGNVPEAAHTVSKVAAIFSWSLMVMAYGSERRRADKAAT